jgi:soluble lytic murein transglycosylase-like protein
MNRCFQFFRRLAALVFILPVWGLSFSCDSPEGASESAEELLRMAREGNTEFFRSWNFSRIDPELFIRRQPGAAYYLACAFQDLKMDREAEILLEKTFLLDADPWRKEAALELSKNFGEKKDALPLALRYCQLYPEDPRGKILVMKALLGKADYTTLLTEAENFLSAPPQGAGPEETGQALFSRAQAELRLDHPRFPETIRGLFRSCPASAVHAEACREITEGSEKFFSETEMAFFEAKTRRAAGEWGSALGGYTGAASLNAGDPVFLREYGETLQRAAGWKEGLKELNRLLPGLSGDARIVCEEYLGRFYRLGGEYDKSLKSLENALRGLGNREGIFPRAPGEEACSDRLIWYLLSNALRASVSEMIQILPGYLARVQDRAYFSDILESLSSQLVRAGDWKRLQAVYMLIRPHAHIQDIARYSFLLAAAIRAGLYAPPRGSLPPEYELFDYAAAHGEPYYRILAALSLKGPEASGENFSLPLYRERPFSPPKAEPSPEDLFVRGFLGFRLSLRAVRNAKGLQDSLDPETILLVAENEASEGRYIDGLRLLQRAVRKPGVVPDRRMLEALYPQAYSGEMSQAMSLTSLPPALFYGLVREESYFDPSIGSWAGALGLSQLMPATAREVAQRLEINSPDLTDPLTNLRIGSWYLDAQWKRFGDGLCALAAYNAGTNRVSRWKKQSKGLPGVLFAESLPIFETREYVRKVLVSAVHYGYLYYHATPRETVREIFKDFI